MTTSSTEGRIFVSSTCFDLVDVRAELNVALRQAGLTPIMSDQLDSEFTGVASADSIATCLAQLRTCEYCVLVLSQRYGPRLGKVGFPDVSATHLEYLEARKCAIPVTLYVRDRLHGEYDLWKSNGSLKTRWAKPEDAEALFKFMDEHRALESGGPANWVWPFRHSVELCERVLKDLGSTASAAAVRMIAQRGELPQLSVSLIRTAADSYEAGIRNSGPVAALALTVYAPTGMSVFHADALTSEDDVPTFKFAFRMAQLSLSATHLPALRAEYAIPSGEQIVDYFGLVPTRSSGIAVVHAGRRVLGRSLRVTAPEVVQDKGMIMVARAPLAGATDKQP